MKTRRELIDILTSAGLAEETAEALAKETAPARHAWRIEQAKLAAGASGEPVSILLADYLGVGGRDDCEGLSTLRVPALEELGKGRKQAADGEAWSAAIRRALIEFCSPVATIAPSLDGFTVQVDDGPTCAASPLPGPWLRSVAREGLRVAVAALADNAGIQPRTADLPVIFEGTVEEWGRVVQAAEQVTADEYRTAMEGSIVYDWADLPSGGFVSLSEHGGESRWFGSEIAAAHDAASRGCHVVPSDGADPRPQSDW